MSQTLGEDWRTLFDLSFMNAQKPGFFRKVTQPCFKIDQTIANFKGKVIDDANELRKGDCILEGNFT
jgi:hypothetical protein